MKHEDHRSDADSSVSAVNSTDPVLYDLAVSRALVLNLNIDLAIKLRNNMLVFWNTQPQQPGL